MLVFRLLHAAPVLCPIHSPTPLRRTWKTSDISTRYCAALLMTTNELPGFPHASSFPYVVLDFELGGGRCTYRQHCISMCTFLLLYKWCPSRPSSNFDLNFVLARVELEPEIGRAQIVSLRGPRSCDKFHKACRNKAPITSR
jgi:hypothetical protein